ncbi:MAG: hypothetical protein GYB25_07565 [Rhodobacteraceae bacterium]|nr:hypothetical protein [Paracoccaceae bacterium]
MSVTYTILKEHGLVYVKYKGVVRIKDTMETFARYAGDPDCRPGQKQFVDLSKITEVEQDFAKLMEIQAKKAEVFMAGGAQTIMVYYAPTALGQRMGGIIVRSWEPFASVVALVIDSETEALSVLGLRETRIDDLIGHIPELRTQK